MPSDLVNKVRAKYPEYADISDDELEVKVLTKYPEYADLASSNAKLRMATEQSVSGATAGAVKRTQFPGVGAIHGGYDVPPARLEHFDPSTTDGKIALALTGGAGAMMLGPAGALALGKSVATGVVGAGLGGHAGKFVGGGIGFPKEGEAVGRFVGGLAGAAKPSSLLSMANVVGGHKLGIAKMLAGRVAAPAAEAVIAAESGSVAAVAEGLVAKKMFKSLPDAMKLLKGLRPEQVAAVAKQAGLEAPKAAGAIEGALPFVRDAQNASILTKQEAINAAWRAQKAAKASSGSKAILDFAKKSTGKTFKTGEKVWVELGADGNPVRYLTPDQAGAAARAGKNTTWAKQLGGS